MRKYGKFLAIFCLLCGVIPLFYGVVNLGGNLLIACGTLLLFLPDLWKKSAHHPRLRALAAGILCAGLAVCVLISALMLRQALFTPPPDQDAGVVIVLGAKIIGTQPSRILQRRLDVAANYLAQHPEALCIVCGGQGKDEALTEAAVMAAYLEAKGVPSERILLEDASVNTRENLLYAARLVPGGPGSAVIVTDGFHQLRAGIYARASGFEEIYSLPSFTPPGLLPAYWVREICGVAAAWAQTTAESRFV